MKSNKIVVDKAAESYVAYEVIANVVMSSGQPYGNAVINLYEVQDYEDKEGLPCNTTVYMGAIHFTSKRLTFEEIASGEHKTSGLQPMKDDYTFESNFSLWYSPSVDIQSYMSVKNFVLHGPAIAKVLSKIDDICFKDQRYCEDQLWRYIGALVSLNIPQARYDHSRNTWAIVHNSAFKRSKPAYMR